ncbi:MAG TPA: hypothetical protein VFH89_01460 [Sphingomicrobium sp.]|nr:hypothetical protein [Sphingomicrobium sp.]
MTFFLGVLLLVSGNVPTDSATAQVPAQQAAADADADANKADKVEKKICKREESTESRLGGKRICLTAEQWKRAAQGAR